MTTIPTNLIEKALALTGKTMEDMLIPKYMGDAVVNGMAFPEFDSEFSIEKFGWYLLSPEFIEKYELKEGTWGTAQWNLGEAIYEYQKGNEQPLISLLEKI